MTSADLSAIENKYDKTGGMISGDVLISGDMCIKGELDVIGNSIEITVPNLNSIWINRQSVQDMLDNIDETYAKKTGLDGIYAKLDNPVQEIKTAAIDAKYFNVLDSNRHCKWYMNHEGFIKPDGYSGILNELPSGAGVLLNSGNWVEIQPRQTTGWTHYELFKKEPWQFVRQTLTGSTTFEFDESGIGGIHNYIFNEYHILFKSDTDVELNLPNIIKWQNNEFPDIVNKPAVYELILTKIPENFLTDEFFFTGGIIRYE